MESSSVFKLADFYDSQLHFLYYLLNKTIQAEVNKKSDLPVALVHFLLTKHYNFRCVGVGDDKTLPEEEGSELLPDSWNDDDTKYSLRYVHYKQLEGHITEDALLVNNMDITTTPGADPLRIGEPRRGGSYQPYGYDPRAFGFPDVGRGDLDPLGRGGSGLLLTFPSHPNKGPGPAPLFDPFTPLNSNAGRDM